MIRLIILSFVFALSLSVTAYAQLPAQDIDDDTEEYDDDTEGADPYTEYSEDVYMDMEMEANLATPVIPDNAKAAVRRFVRKKANELKSQFKVDLMRDGEVMVVSVACDDLFQPNDTLLSGYGTRRLASIIPQFADPLQFKIIITMNTDDTGSILYRNFLSQARINSVYDWFLDNMDAGTISEDLVVVPYSLDSMDPLYPNDTRKNRSGNRRLDIYFVPGPKLIQEAESGQIR